MNTRIAAIGAGFTAIAVAALIAGWRQPTAPPKRPSAVQMRKEARRPVPPVSQTFTAPQHRLAVEKPASRDWAMADNPKGFHAPFHHPAKVLEMRREPRGGDRRFAILELFVFDMADVADPVKEVEKLERAGQRGRFGRYQVVEEGPITIGGQTLTRRLTLWDTSGTKLARQHRLVRQTKFISLRTVRDGKLYIVIGGAPAEHYDALLPEFEQVFKSLKIG